MGTECGVALARSLSAMQRVHASKGAACRPYSHFDTAVVASHLTTRSLVGSAREKRNEQWTPREKMDKRKRASYGVIVDASLHVRLYYVAPFGVPVYVWLRPTCLSVCVLPSVRPYLFSL